MHIPFNRIYLTGQESKYIQEALDRGDLSGGGSLSHTVADTIASKLKATKVLLTTSGTAALEMAVILAGIMRGNEVIMPSFTFVSTANAVVLRGAKPVLAEINAEDMNLDVEKIPEKITVHTRAIMPVHYAGLPCDMDKINLLAKSCQLKVIEDAAHALFASYQGIAAGTWGDYGCFSFHGTKNIICGEGGALVINKPENIHQAELIWHKGTDRERFNRKEVAFYTWQSIGSSYPPSELLVAFLQAQLEGADEILEQRRRLWDTYARELKLLVDDELIKIQRVNPNATSSHHIFYIVLPGEEKRRQVEDYLASQGIATAFHFIPLHLSPMGRRLGYAPGDLPVTEKMARSLLRLPLYPGLTEAEQSYVIDHLKKAVR